MDIGPHDPGNRRTARSLGVGALAFVVTAGLTAGLGARMGRAAVEPVVLVPAAPVERSTVPVQPELVAEDDPAPTREAHIQPPASGLPLLVLATLVADSPERSRATILDQERMRMASFGVGEPLRPGVTLGQIHRGQVWVEEQGELRALTLGNQPIALAEGPTPGLLGAGLPGEFGISLKPVQTGGLSVGRPNQGRLINAVQLPENSGLYARTQPNASWGASHTIASLQRASARFRRVSGYRGTLAIGGISRQHGGYFPPHKSHQSGRDVDVVLPRLVGDEGRAVDWAATWAFVHTLIEDRQVTQIFLSYERQRELFAAARAAGVSANDLETWLQYPKGIRGPGLVRHQPGHRNHLHIRFRCGPEDQRCSGW